MTSPPSSSDGGASSSAYSHFSEGVRRWIEGERWSELRDIQENAAAHILGRQVDVLISAPTAGGKTEAAFMPIVSSLENSPTSTIGCVCISPLKALINDQFRRLELLCEAAGVPIYRWHGDVSQSSKNKLLKTPRGVLLITPESLEAHFVRRGTKLRSIFGDLAYVVVDEFHAFIGSERGRQMQSLLARLEMVARRKVPRIGLSATMGDMELAAGVLRAGHGQQVVQVEGDQGGSTVRIQVRGYRRSSMLRKLIGKSDAQAKADNADGDSEIRHGDLHEIANHLYKTLRGTDNLIFANSRNRVEVLADILRRTCEEQHVPNEFLPHHGCLSKDIREDAEALLKDANRPGNVLATTTLEMGIDVGSVCSIAQVGVPPSVASLKQRLGRSGRRDTAATLRVYITEEDQPNPVRTQDNLRASMVQTIAMVELLLENWCEPPEVGALHLSTLIQQLLSLIAQYGAIRPDDAFTALCKTGPFRNVSSSFFQDILRELGKREFIAQINDGTLVFGLSGEKLVDHYEFYAAFQAAEEFTIIHAGRTIGSLPVTQGIEDGQHIIFAGRRWQVISVDEDREQIIVKPSRGGTPPLFEGSPVSVHDRVRAKMLEVYRSVRVPKFLDKTAQGLLQEGRSTFFRLGLAESHIIQVGSHAHLYPWVGDRVLLTLQLALKARGFEVSNEGISIIVKNTSPHQLQDALESESRAGLPDAPSLTRGLLGKRSEKYDHLLPEHLLNEDFAAKRLDVAGAEASLAALVDS